MGIRDKSYVPRTHRASLCSSELKLAFTGKYFRLSFTKGHERLMEGISCVPNIINNINIVRTVYLLPSKIKLNPVSIVGKTHSIKKEQKQWDYLFYCLN